MRRCLNPAAQVRSMSDDPLRCVPRDEALALLDSMLVQGIAARVRVTGRSMEPTIVSNDYVLIEPITGRIRVGDVVLWRRSQAACVCIHRIIWHRRGIWRTKGDALKSLDPPIDSEQILGRVTAIEREGLPKRDLRSLAERIRALAMVSFSLGGLVLRWGFRQFYSDSSCF